MNEEKRIIFSNFHCKKKTNKTKFLVFKNHHFTLYILTAIAS